MTNENISFETEDLRGKYTKVIEKNFQNNNLHNWYVSPSATKGEIFIHPRDGLPENERAISRISLQIKDNSISFGVSGYFPARILGTYPEYKRREYKYHDKEGNASPEEAVLKSLKGDNPKRAKGRWWLTKSLDNLDVASEFKDIEHLLN
jgi:hypothetical protein